MGHDRRADGAGRGDGVRKLAEAQHHTIEEVVAYVEQTTRVAEITRLGKEEYAILAPTILNLLASKQVLYEQPQASPLMLDGLHNLR